MHDDTKHDVAIILAEGREGLSRTEAEAALARMRAIGKKLHRIYERQCNGHQDSRGNWDEAASKRDEAAEEKLEKQLKELGAGIGLVVDLNTDPRGNPVKIMTPKTKRSNTMGGPEDGWRL